MSAIPETTTHQEPLPTFEDYVASTAILRRVEDLHRFTFTVQYQQNGALTNEVARQELMSGGPAVLNDLLETTGVHYLHELSVNSGGSESEPGDNTPHLEFAYTHDTMHCSFQFFNDRFVIARSSSTFSDFYRWYCTVMPEARRVESTMRQIIERASGRSLRPVASWYEFSVDFSRFRHLSNDAEESRNMDVLQEIIPNLPFGGSMVPLTDQQFYRLDLTLSKGETFGDLLRNVWYTLSAPFNRNGRFIVFTAQLRNASIERLDGSEPGMVAFDEDYGSDYRMAIVEFFRDRALEGFMWQLLRSWNFETERNL